MTDKPPLQRMAPEGSEAVPVGKPAKKPRARKTARTTRSVVAKKSVAKAPRKNTSSKRKTAKPSSARLVARVTQAIERELSQIETIIGGDSATPARRTEAERRARTLASLARTLAEMSRLRAMHSEPKASDDDAVPSDLDDFRATLERRLEQVVAARTEHPARGDEQE